MVSGTSDWAPLAAGIIASVGKPALPSALAAMLRHLAPFTYTVMFGYCGSARPIDLYDDFPEGKRRIFVTDYQAGPYLLDPFYLGAVKPMAPGLYRLRDLAPDRFYQGEYFRNYYVQTGLAEEIGFFVPLPGRTMAVISLMRAERPFSQREFRALQATYPLVSASAARQWGDLAWMPGAAAEGRGIGAPASTAADVFASFGEGVLTPREREVAEFTIKGHSAEAVGHLLGIAPGTVRIHRRNIYAKLRINSQRELFSRVISVLAGSG
jgi:DNA-binding CsgD family transcriptional regulator